MKVTHLRSVAVTAPAPAELRDFYEQSWGLDVVAEDAGVTYLRGRGHEHHVLTITADEQARVLGYELGLADRAAVDEAARELERRPQVIVVRPPALLDMPGGGYGMTVADPDGRLVGLTASVAEHDRRDDQDDPSRVRPVKISHVVLNSPDLDAYEAFLVDALGFALADELPHMSFYRCNRDHHSVAVTRAPHASLNHIAFEVGSVDELLRGVDELRGRTSLIWGPNRHGPGHNAFGYFTAPNGQVIEYTAEVEQVDPEAPPTPRMWAPDEVAVVDEWAVAETLRPTPDARQLMLGAPEAPASGAPRLAATAPRPGGTDDATHQ